MASTPSSKRSADTAPAHGGQRRQCAEQAEAGEIRRAAAAVARLAHHAGDLFLLHPQLEALELGVELRDQRVDGLPVALAARLAGGFAELYQR
jgi:hypothetical protein